MYFAVFAGYRESDQTYWNPNTQRHEVVQGRQGINWGGIIGVFKADDADAACRKAAKKTGVIGSYFAIEGYPWGIELFDVDDVEEFGVDSEKDKSSLNSLEQRTRELERSVGMRTDGTFTEDTPTG